MISTQLQPALATLASRLSVNPSAGASSIRGACTAIQASRRITIAATMISEPANTALKYSALWWPNGWLASAGWAASRTASSAAEAVATFTRLSSASE